MIAAIALAISLSSPCAHRHGSAYIVCRETGNNPAKYAHGEPHPGPSSASGLYGMLTSTRRTYGTAERYMRARYGSWARAERFHRAHGWW